MWDTLRLGCPDCASSPVSGSFARQYLCYQMLIPVTPSTYESLADAADMSEERAPLPGDRVTVSNGSTVWTILSVSHSGKEFGLHVPNTKLERFRVPVSDLIFVDSPRPPKPREQEKPKFDIEKVREHLASVHHSMIEHLQGEVAARRSGCAARVSPPARPWTSSQMRPRRAGRKKLNQLKGSWRNSVTQPSGHQRASNHCRRVWKCPRTPIETAKLSTARPLVELRGAGRLPQASTSRTKAQIGRSSSGPSRTGDGDLPDGVEKTLPSSCLNNQPLDRQQLAVASFLRPSRRCIKEEIED